MSGFNFGGTGGSTGFSFGGAASTQASTGFSFGTSSAAASTPATAGFSFSTPTANPAAARPAGAAATPGFSFGAIATPAAPASATAAPAASGALAGGAQPAFTGFGTAAPAGGAPAATSAAFTGFNLGAAKTAASTASVQPLTATSTATKGFSLGGGVSAQPGASAPSQPVSTGLGFSLGGAKTTAAPAAQTATTSAPATAGFKLAGFGATSTAGSTLGTGLGQTLTGKPLGQPAPAPASTAASAPTLGQASSAANAASVATTTATSSAPAAAGSAQTASITYKQLEEEINKWTVQLDEQEKVFIQQATQVNAWDRLLIDNGEKISELNSEVERVKLDQRRLDGELDFISAQQAELEELLAPLEAAVAQTPPLTMQQHADLEREHTFKLAENIDAQLKRMVQDLKEIIDHMNSSGAQADQTDAIQQISKILNAHMHSLQWIDTNTALLQRRVDDVTKLAEHRKKEQERNFRLAYD